MLCFATYDLIFIAKKKEIYEPGLPPGRPLFKIRKSCIQWVYPNTRVYLRFESSQNLGSPLLLFESRNVHSMQTKGHPKTTLTRFWPLLNIYRSLFYCDWGNFSTPFRKIYLHLWNFSYILLTTSKLKIVFVWPIMKFRLSYIPTLLKQHASNYFFSLMFF